VALVDTRSESAVARMEALRARVRIAVTCFVALLTLFVAQSMARRG
jgi:hypothetical protein